MITPDPAFVHRDDYGRSRMWRLGWLRIAVVASVMELHPELDAVVRRMDQILLRAQVPLRRLNQRMAQEHLNLLKFPAGDAAKLRACATTIVGCNTGHSRGHSTRPQKLPDHLLAEDFALDMASPIEGSRIPAPP